MKVRKVLEDVELVIADLEVMLNDKVRHSPTLCARYDGKIIPLNTPDGRPVLMSVENAIDSECDA